MITTNDIDEGRGFFSQKPVYYLEAAIILCILSHYGDNRPDLAVRIGGDKVHIVMKGVEAELRQEALRKLEVHCKECFMLRHWGMTVDIDVKG